MLVRTRTIEYEAIRLAQHIVLPDSKGRPGDWLLITEKGILSVVTDKELKEGSRFEIPDAPTASVRPTQRRARRPKRAAKAPAKAAPKPATGRGRLPTALRTERMAEAKRLIESGKSIQEAATAVSVSYSTVYGWAKANGWDAA